jgi:hypothetical protein
MLKTSLASDSNASSYRSEHRGTPTLKFVSSVGPREGLWCAMSKDWRWKRECFVKGGLGTEVLKQK